MRFQLHTKHFRSKSRSATLHSLLYGGLLLLCIGLIIPWPALSATTIAVGISVPIMCLTLIWLVVRQRQLQSRVRHLETHLRRMQLQKSNQTVDTRPIVHVDSEHYFKKDLTKH